MRSPSVQPKVCWAHGVCSSCRRKNENLVPSPGELSTPILLPWPSTISFTMARPRPESPCCAWPGTLKNFSKMCGRYSCGIPLPESSTLKSTLPSSSRADTLTCPPGGVCFRALLSRFVNTISSRNLSASTFGVSPGKSRTSETPLSANEGLISSTTFKRICSVYTGASSSLEGPDSIRPISSRFSIIR